MANYSITKIFTAVAAGAQNETITLSDPYQQYIVTSGSISYTSSDSLTITLSGTPYYGMKLEIIYAANITLANHVDAKIVFTDGGSGYSIKGDGSGNLPAIFSKKRFILTAVYNGSSWIYNVSASADNSAIINNASLSEIANVAPGKLALAEGSIIVGNSSTVGTALDAKTSGQILVGDGTTVASVAVSGDVTLASNGAVTIANNAVETAMIAANAVTNAKLAGMTRGTIKYGNSSGAAADLAIGASARILQSDGTDPSWVAVSGDATIAAGGALTIGAGVIEQTMLDSECAVEVIPLLVSFEAAGGVFASVGDFKIKMPYPGTVSEIYAYAVDAIAGTDNGTIVAKNNAGTTMTNGTITFTASDARGTAYTVTPSANNTFVAGDILTFTTAKTTAGGVVQLSIKVIRT